MVRCLCLSGGSSERNKIHEINDYGQENAVLYSEDDVVLGTSLEGFGSVCSLPGTKGFNQDSAILHLGYGGGGGGALCGVFDGHGDNGHCVSKIARNQLPAVLLGNMNTWPTRQWKRICHDTFSAVDKKILNLKKTLDCSCSGTTAVLAVTRGEELMVANLGDSRAVLIRANEKGEAKALQLTNDLKPSVPSEAERIRKRNGRVLALEAEPHIQRVWLPFQDYPGLAMSRALGDFVLKNYGVIEFPDVSTHRITHHDRFLVLASDGVWDVLSNEEVAKVVMGKERDDGAAANAGAEAAAEAWRLKFPAAKVDDISVVCLSLNKRL
ncbi:PREDICTED: probable protein phosphatase 2C 61 [Tarenaya hassleriana]|uniref:probable protein phosphatase 2C 61 n=1 Tax=Tarenaya hassleriana TaxID=28532 RepID=UPI00053C4830|nr:PREDICTED: probable protein phosphatase 2C 61 [Tarenaya hassleriana]